MIIYTHCSHCRVAWDGSSKKVVKPQPRGAWRAHDGRGGATLRQGCAKGDRTWSYARIRLKWNTQWFYHRFFIYWILLQNLTFLRLKSCTKFDYFPENGEPKFTRDWPYFQWETPWGKPGLMTSETPSYFQGKFARFLGKSTLYVSNVFSNPLIFLKQIYHNLQLFSFFAS